MRRFSASAEITSILEEVLGNRGHQYRQPNWLKSDCNEPVWRCSFGEQYNLDIDFRIRINGKHLLTSPLHANLLESITSWLTVQTHPDTNGGAPLGAGASYYRVYQTLHLIDYILLNSNRLNIDTCGLEGLTANDFYGLLLDVSKSNITANSVYRWPETLTDFLRTKLLSADQKELTKIIDTYPWLADDIPDETERVLELTVDELAYARAWLFSNGYYRTGVLAEGGDSNFRYRLESARLSRELYADTLRGKFQKPQIYELNLLPSGRYKSEYRTAPINKIEDKRLSEKLLVQYLRSLKSLAVLEEIGIAVPQAALKALDDRGFLLSLETKPIGRHKTLPSDATLYGLRKSIEFILHHGQTIVDAVVNVYKEMHRNKTPEASRCHFKNSLAIKHGKNIGIRYWSLTLESHLYDNNPNRKVTKRQGWETFYPRLRKNEGLWELVQVLYGAVQFCVGLLMARRQTELRMLIAGQALDKTRRYLIFRNGKSGILGKQQIEARPIPEIAAKAIGLLENLQDELICSGIISQRVSVFAHPLQKGLGLVTPTASSYNRCLDIFCDYVEMPLDDCGRRYYPRQHPLRRGFTMLFFWGNSFGGMETLRWFLGHTDLEHLYHYITESTPGDILRSVKAQYAGEQLRKGSPEAKALSDLLIEHFGIEKFSVLDSDELDEYIEELVLQSCVEIEPEFLTGPENQNYRILIKVNHHNGAV